MLLAVSQRVARNPPPAQLAFARHSTHRMVVVLQWSAIPPGPMPHCASAVQDTTQRFVIVSQARPASPHCESAVHATHRFVVVLQCVRPPPPGPAPVQLVSAVHCTQRLVVVLQTAPVAEPAHWAFVVQATTQV